MLEYPPNLLEAFQAFITTETGEQAEQVLEQYGAVLLTDEADYLYQVMKAANDSNPANVRSLEQHWHFRDMYVDKDVRDFLRADRLTIHHVLKEKQSILTTPKAVGAAKQIVAQLKERNDNPDEPWFQWHRELKVRYLEDAQEFGVDEAKHKYLQGYREIENRIREHFHG